MSALKVVEGAKSQGMQVGAQAEKGKGIDSLLNFRKESSPVDTLILAQ